MNASGDSIFAQYDKADFPGCALGIIKDSKLIYSRGYGLASLELNWTLQELPIYNAAIISNIS